VVTSWHILAAIEADAGNSAAAGEAKRKAIAAYLVYRRDGGEDHSSVGRITLAVAQALLSGDSTGAASHLQRLVADPNWPARFLPFLQALQRIVAGSRDRALADSEDLHYQEAAEILFLIETLEQGPRRPHTLATCASPLADRAVVTSASRCPCGLTILDMRRSWAEYDELVAVQAAGGAPGEHRRLLRPGRHGG
jgi:hypothetical protein